MSRRAVEVLTSVAAAVIMLGMVLLLGAAIKPPAQPITLPARGAGICLEAPVTTLSAASIAGHGQVCIDGDSARPTFQVSGLTAGQRYAAWFGYTTHAPGVPPTPGGTIDVGGDNPDAPLRRFGEAIAPESGELEFRAELHDLLLTPNARITLLLVNPGGTAGPIARAFMVLP